MGKFCLSHPERPAAAMCHRCHKPICRSCTLVTPQGQFCGTECSLLYRELKEKLKSPDPARRGGFFVKAAAVFVLLVVVMVGIHWGATKGPKGLQRIDLIGVILEKVKGYAPPDQRR